MGTIIRVSSASWFRIWIGLEINLLSFVPLMIKNNNLYSSEATLKYFLTQALASSILLFFIIFFSFLSFNILLKFNFIINIIFASSFIIKIGIAPFHFWFPIVIEGLNWINNLLLITWQKIAPIIILTYCININFFIFSIIISIVISRINGLNQTSLRKLLAYSSINHLGWILTGILNNQNIWIIYFIFYCFLTISIVLIFNNFKIFNLNQIFSFFNFKNLIKTIIFLPLLSLGGLPPFLGFFPKWIIIEYLISINYLFIIFLLIYFTLITLYFYLRISYSSLLLNYNEINWNFNNFYNKNNFFLLSIFLFINIFGLIFINLFFFIF